MANRNGRKYGFTGLFPIKPGGHSSRLRNYLRSLDRHRYGSPLSDLDIVHMARWTIIERLPYQGLPAKRDILQSQYLLFLCDFDGESVDALVWDFVRFSPHLLIRVWGHCVGFPGARSGEALAIYFEQCQLNTDLLLADVPDATVNEILRALVCRRMLADLIDRKQRNGWTSSALQNQFQQMWAMLSAVGRVQPGSL